MFKSWTAKKQYEKYFNKSEYEMSGFTPDKFRKDEGTYYNKRSILMFGCSHIFGPGLKDEQTFSYKLSKATHRPVYNRAFWGWAPQHMLYILQSQDWIKSVKEPEYIITLFIPEYNERLFLHQGWPFDSGMYLRYEVDKKNNLKLIPFKHYPWYWRTLMVKYVQYYIENNIQRKDFAYTNRLYLGIMRESMNIIRSKYPDAKVILLLYQGYRAVDDKSVPPIVKTEEYFNSKPFTPKTLQELKNMGYIIINMEEFVGHTLATQAYKIQGDPTHPNEKMWDEFVPLLKNKFNL